jgi:hypothetical protein
MTIVVANDDERLLILDALRIIQEGHITDHAGVDRLLMCGQEVGGVVVELKGEK